jgi:ABC-type polysaccharide/polyol phosphate export permease
LNWNKWIRQIHRWASIAFVAVVTIIFVMLGVGRQPAYWLYLLPLLPLALLTLTGVYLFALPYVARWRREERATGT